MKATVKIAELVAALARLKGVAASKSTLPILGGVLITTHDGGFSMTATDLDSFLTIEVPAQIDDAGTIVVSCARLAAAVAKMDGENLALDLKAEGKLAGHTESMRFELCGWDSAEFPPAPSLGNAPWHEFGEGVLADALGRELAAVSEDETRYVLNGVYLTADEESPMMVATDGRRLSCTRMNNGATKAKALDVIVPTAAASVMACLDGGGATRLRADAQSIEATGKGWRLVSKVIEGNFPNWKQVMPPEGAANWFEVDRDALVDALKFVATICGTKGGSMKMELGKKFLRLTACVPDVGETSADVAAEVHGALVAGFNPGFLLAALEVLAAGTVKGAIHDEASPLRLTDGKTVNVLMPMRVG